MNRSLISTLVASVALFGIQLAHGAETYTPITTGPQFRAATIAPDRAASAPLIASVERALLRSDAACASHDDNAVAEVFTDFAIIEYQSSVVGQFVGISANTDEACWATSVLATSRVSGSSIWIYPTSEPNDVIIQYTAVVGSGTAQHTIQDLALVEMTGDRIARIRDYMPRVESGFRLDLAKQ
jgi:hypothetical protein